MKLSPYRHGVCQKKRRWMENKGQENLERKVVEKGKYEMQNREDREI